MKYLIQIIGILFILGSVQTSQALSLSPEFAVEQEIIANEEKSVHQELQRQDKPPTESNKDANQEDIEVVPLQHIQTTLLKGIHAVAYEAQQLVRAISDLHRLQDWLHRQVTDPQAQAFWQEFILVLLTSFAAALLMRTVLVYSNKWFFNWLLMNHQQKHWQIIRNKLVFAVMSLLPTIGFAVISYVVLGLYSPQYGIEKMALLCLNAVILMSFIHWLVEVFFNTKIITWRWFTLSDTVALIWRHIVIRFFRLGIYGFFIIQIIYLLGAPRFVRELLLFMLVVALVIMVLRLVHIYQKDVSQFLKNLHVVCEQRGVSFLLSWLSYSWHWLVTLYVLLAFITWLAFRSDGVNFMLTASIGSLLVIGGCWIVQQHIGGYISRRLSSLQQFPQRHPILSAQWARYGQMLKITVNVIFYSIVILLLLQAWHIDLLAWLVYGQGRAASSKTITIAIIVGISLFVWISLSALITAYMTQQAQAAHRQLSPQLKTLLTVGHNALLITIIIIAGLFILSVLNFNIGPLLASAGVVGLAIAFGAKQLVQDMITGLFILAGNTIAVDDVVTAGGVTGKVEAISIRSLRLRESTGDVHTIPFSTVGMVTNKSRNYGICWLEVTVDYAQSIDNVIALMKQAGQVLWEDTGFKHNLLEPIQVLGIDKLADNGMLIKAIIKTRPAVQDEVRREYYLRLKQLFDTTGIMIAYPQRVVHNAQS